MAEKNVELDPETLCYTDGDNAQQKTTHNETEVLMQNYPEIAGISCKIAPATTYTTSDRAGTVKIRFSNEKDSLASKPAISVMQLMDNTVKKFASRTAMKVERDGKWMSWSYQEYLQEIKTAAKGFIKLGLETYHGVGILGFNSPEWLFSDLGAIYAGGLATGIYTTNNPEACRYVCADAGCNIVVVENELQLKKIEQVWDQLPELKAVIQYLGEITDKKENIYTWNEFMQIGRNENDTELNKRMHSQAPNQCCTLIYTSGTTGEPKGVMLSHDNLITGCENACFALRPHLDPDSMVITEETISYLPLSHIAAQITDIWLACRAGGCVWFARPDALKGSLLETLAVARPTLFLGVPRVYEKIEEKLKGFGATIQGVKRKVGTWAKGVALKGNENKENGKKTPCGWTIATGLILKKGGELNIQNVVKTVPVFARLYFQQVQKKLGLDRCKMLITGAAPISKQTLQYFQSLNLPLYEGYGLSETSGGLTLNTYWNIRTTSIGKPMPLSEVRIEKPDDDGNGELCFRGRNILMGYLNNDEKTIETFDADGWFHTGDIGKVDEDGFLYITGRIKEIIITAGGENIAPVPIEENIKAECPLIATAMVIGDRKKFLSCLLTVQVEIDLETGLPTDNLLPIAVNYCKDLGLNVSKGKELAPDVPDILQKAIQDAINNANKKATSNAAKVQKWKLLPFEFTTAGGELGPVQKLRRPHTMEMYKELIDSFYN